MLLILTMIFFATWAFSGYAGAEPAAGQAAEDAGPAVSAQAAVVLDAKTGQVLYAKEPSKRMYPASTTKILTALVVLQNARLDDRIKATGKVVNTEGSAIWLKEGEELTVSDGLYALLLNSANDVAVALAEMVGGSEKEFASMMNRTAKACGATDSHFNNPHGLPDEDHYTTALDLAKITRVAMGNRLFKEIVATKTKNIERQAPDGLTLLINHNKLLWRYDGAIGVKTGYTTQSGQCLVSAARRGEREIISVILGDDLSVWDNAAALLDHGFSSYHLVELAKAGEVVGKFPVQKGTEQVLGKTARSLWSNIPAGADPVIIPRWRLEMRPIEAPVNQGDCIGTVVITGEQGEIGRVSVVAGNSVARLSIWPPVFRGVLVVVGALVVLRLLSAWFKRHRTRSFPRL
ncbi:MAG: D-alanyl-D-alanine carboxypeptidase family protein [Bacillota bacterium]